MTGHSLSELLITDPIREEDGPLVREIKAIFHEANTECRLALGIDEGTPNGGEHCAPPGGPDNTCYRHPDGHCDSCGYEA